MMDLKTFERLMDVHGGDLSRWPQAEAVQAEILLQQNAEARALMAQGRALDDALDAHRPGPLPELLAARIHKAVAKTPQDRGPIVNDNRPHRLFGGMMPRDRRWAGAVALAACVMIMVLAGYAARLQHDAATAPLPDRLARPMDIAAMPPATSERGANAAADNPSGRAVDLFVLAMADPFMYEVEEELLLDTLAPATETAAAAPVDGPAIDLFLQQYFANLADDEVLP